jgi:hypothetical protein
MTSTYPFRLVTDALDSARITAGLTDKAGIAIALREQMAGLTDKAGSDRVPQTCLSRLRMLTTS